MTTAKINSTFCAADPWWANACVGNNGDPSYVDYSQGFSTAANVLIDQVLAGEGIKLSVDTLIYPVCFNMRHSVELRLKGAIQELIEIAEIKALKISFDLTGSHDIGNIWSFFKEQSEKIDHRYTFINNLIHSTIHDIASIDATGQTFRYPTNTESQKHLTEVSCINFLTLKFKFNLLETNLDKLHQLNRWLQQEYSQRTFTRNLSRQMIYSLAMELPRTSEWNRSEFNIIKTHLKSKYSISSNELGKAIDLIKSHYSLSPLIERARPLLGITKAQLFDFFDAWTEQNTEYIAPSQNDELFTYSEASNSMLGDIIERAKRRTKIQNKFKTTITPEYLAGLHTLFYFSYERQFSEHYAALYDIEFREKSSAPKPNKNESIKDFMHIFDKTNAMQNIITSLFSIGHKEIAEEIIEKYKVSDSVGWIEDARRCASMLYPDFAKYQNLP